MFTVVVWLSFADWSKIPYIMASYLFPYPLAIKGFGDAAAGWVITLQLFTIFSIYLAVAKEKGRSLGANAAASILGMIWYISVSLIIVVGNFQ
jgi:hypothetical protein